MTNFLYSVEREYPVAIETLWNAWECEEALRTWYCPTELSVEPGTVENDVRVGGIWTVGVSVPAYNFVAYFFGKYSEVEPLKKMVHSMHYTQSLDEFKARDFDSPSHRIKIDFEDRGGSSWVRFSQFGEMPEGEAPRAQAGMESYFDNLGKYLG